MILKTRIKQILQKIMGFDNYLFMFSRFKILTLKSDQNENQFFTFMDLLPKKGVILDIGANIGIMTCLLARKFPEASIVSIEPMPDNLKALRRICEHFNLKNVHIADIALGTENSTVKMIMPTEGSVKFQGLSHVVTSETEKTEGLEFTVPCYRLDDYIENSGIKTKVTGIKMDVENFESKVLKGALKLLVKDKPVVYTELWETENRIESISFMESISYKTYILSGDKLHPYNQEKDSAHNFFFIPEGFHIP